MNRIIEMGKNSFTSKKNLPILIIILFNLLIIPFILSDYGESWDENHQYNHYADHALNAYGTWFREGRSEGLIESSGAAKDLHGPAYVMTVELITRLTSRGGPDWFKTDIRHFLHFLTFQIGIFSLYSICRRWLDVRASLGASLLFMTQPVFWGHGIINPKDMPFAALFLLGVSLGLKMYDSLFPATWDQVASIWSSLDSRIKHKIGITVSLWALSMVILFAGTKTISDITVSMINHAYANPDSMMATLFSTVAKNFGVVPADVYIQKLYMFLLRLRGIYTVFGTIAVIHMVFRNFQAGLRLLGLPVLLAGFVLGVITSMRIAGPLAGILIVIYFLVRAGKKSIVPILVYGFVSIVSMYMTWPYLWGDPAMRFFESLQVMSAFPWQQQVLFNGTRYTADALPNTYLAILFTVQLTEPVWVLFIAGLAVAVVGFIKKREYGWILFLLFGWFIIPFAAFSVGGFSFYDNFRQVLFILPPVFLMAGVAFSKVTQPKWQIALIALVILPGIVDGLRLHPYEYIYYNRFVGGVNGAHRRFELDYWATSYREAAEYVNSIAQPNSYVWVEGPAHIFETYARQDLKVLDAYDPYLLNQEYYLVALTRYDLHLLIEPDAEVIYTISRDGAPLAVVKKP
jgi:hypothetical protein